MYAIKATVTIVSADGWVFTNQVPTFYLDKAVEGISSEAHAEKVALEILRAGSTSPDDQFKVTATLVI